MSRIKIGLSLAAALVLGACGSKRILVGVLVPMTGDAQAYGTSIRAGVKLAFDDAIALRQAPPGLEVLYRDSGSDPSRAAREADTLYSDGSIVIIGGVTSPEAKAMIPVAEKYQRVLISPSASEPGLAASSNLFFRVYPSDEVEGVKAAQFLVTDRKLKTVLVLKEDSSYVRGLLPVFESELGKLGGRVISTIQVGDQDWDKTLAGKLTGEKPDAVYICGYGETILSSVLELRNDKYPGVICTTSAIGTADLIWRGGKLVEGIYFPMTKIDVTSQQEPMKSFVAHYKKANNNLAPDIYAAHGYDAALVVLYGLAGEPLAQPKDLAERLLMLSNKKGVTGDLAFDASGDIRHRLRIYTIRNGKVEDTEAGSSS